MTRPFYQRKTRWIGMCCIVVIVSFLGCSRSVEPSPGSSSFSVLVETVKDHIGRDLPRSIPPQVDMGVLHNDILAAFESVRSFSEPMSREEMIQTFVLATNRTFVHHHIDYQVTAPLVESFVSLFDELYQTHGSETPSSLLQSLEDEGLLSDRERRSLESQLRGRPQGADFPAAVWASQVREASTAYWRETGRLGSFGAPGTEGFWKRLFVVASDSAGGIVGGLLGVGAGTALGGPTGGAVGGVVAGSVGAGVFSGLAVALTECSCE